MQKLDIIYIAGSGRSGSTILDRVLGTYPGTASFNEIYRLLHEGMGENNLCACGERFRACELWQKVVADVFPDPGDEERVRYLHNKYDHTRHVLRLLLFPYGRKYRRELDEYLQWLSKLYFALARESGVSVLIDSSKVPSRALLLSRLPGVRVHVVHLVRDLRAVSNAWMRDKFNPAAGDSLPTYSIARSIPFWYARQFMTELLRLRIPYTRILYEDFVTRPNEVLQSVVDSIEPLKGASLPFEKDGSINLHSLHSIGGNPGRFSTGSTFLRLDKKWLKTMPLSARRLVGFLGFPLLWRYGYCRLNRSGKNKGV